ncbi:MAG: SH3 domain-containing protein [Butyrivibrio sp.]|uniref:SH3 domain-containing protein n=1 Tax=Butyrivibrio sp. TaxID=28121 RepID=UPI0025E663C7|nr:SH3 domain-containing protein [Butyrivibrio sp.]MCR5769999.1 SH3 domain-containing protein [Butyrivibrio sp.]
MIRKNDKNKPEAFRKSEFNLATYIIDNKRIVMPAFLVVCLLITILLAARAGKNDNQTASVSASTASTSSDSVMTASAVESSTADAIEVEMEEDAYPEITALIKKFYDAQATGDMDTINAITEGLTEPALIRYEVSAQYYEKFDAIKVYTKKGPETGAYVTYVYFELYFDGFDQQVPGLQTYYIRTNEDGEYYLYFGELDDEIIEYIEALSVQDDFIDLSNEVAVNYNTMIEENAELSAFLTNFSEEVNKSVGKEVASATAASSGASTDASNEAASDDSAASASTADQSTEETTEEVEEETQSGTVIIEATTVVKIRSSDSTNADVLGKTEVGQQFTQIEALANGWSKIEYDGGEAYVRTEYFEVVSEESDDSTTETDTTSDTEDSKTEDTDDSSDSSAVTSTGTYHVKETVRIRKSASTDSEILGNAYQGDEIKVTNYRADGWCEVEYNGIKGYVKTEYLTK